MLSKLAFLKEKALDNLLDAKKHSDNRQYKYKHEILALMMSKSPEDFYVDSDDGSIMGITHNPTKFKIHVPKKFVPSKVEKKIMPSKSQNQQKLMNWVHAIQKGKATGPEKVKNIASSMKPTSVEHFMGRGHINKELPVKMAFETGFINKALEFGIDLNKARSLFKSALELPPALGEPEPLMKTPFQMDVNKPLTEPQKPGQPVPELGQTPPANQNEHNSLNVPQQLPPSPLGIPQQQAPAQLPAPMLGPKPLKSQPGTLEHAHELYTENNDDSEIRSWMQAHPSAATQASRDSSNAWNNLGNSINNDSNSLNNVQQSGAELDQHLKGINPFMVGSTVQNSTAGQNYNNAWDTHNQNIADSNGAWANALSSDNRYNDAATKQREELRQLRGEPPKPQLLGAQPHPNPGIQGAPSKPHGETLSKPKPLNFNLPQFAGITAGRG